MRIEFVNKIIKNKKIAIPVAVAIIFLLFIVFNSLGGSNVEYVTAEIQRGDLAQTVSETGTVKATKELELNFLNSGKLGEILVDIGNKVEKDQILAKLDYSALSIREKNAQAVLTVAQANLAKLLAGATQHEIAVTQASVDQARASYTSALQELEKARNTIDENIIQAGQNLSDLESDSSDDVTTYEQAVTTAQISLENTKSTYQRYIDNYRSTALITAESKNSVAKTALSHIATILGDDDTSGVLSIKNQKYLEATELDYSLANALLATAESSLAQAKTSQTDEAINQALLSSLEVLNKTFSALNNCFSALENSVTSAAFTQTELDAYKTTISTQQTNVSTAISLVQTAQQNFNDSLLSYDTNVATAEESLAQAQTNLDNAILTAKNTLATARVTGEQQLAAAQAKVDSSYSAWQVAKAQLNSIKAPARSQDINLTQAQVNQAQAELELVRNQIENSIIKAPISGTITKKNYEIGEQTSLSKPVFLLLGENNFEIELDISEADISKVNINNPIIVTLDAFGDDVKFNGQVYFIEPAETVIQDVIYYKVKINFDVRDENVKSGMTANVIITTALKNNVLLAPSRAIIERNGNEKLARVLLDKELKEVPVKIGLRGDEGLVEILSGLEEGDEVVTFIRETK